VSVSTLSVTTVENFWCTDGVSARMLKEFSGVLLGSVSQHCVHHAPCPVLVIRAPDHGRELVYQGA